MTLIVLSIAIPVTLMAGDKEEIIEQIMKGNAYLNKNKKAMQEYSTKGALEFWSSGGLIHEISPSGRPESYEKVNMSIKHIEVIVLVPGKAAVAMYYSEGSMKPKGSPAVSHYMTRVTQAYVKEGDGWKIRASHWSPILGGSGTSQSSTN
mgnify:FL=1